MTDRCIKAEYVNINEKVLGYRPRGGVYGRTDRNGLTGVQTDKGSEKKDIRPQTERQIDRETERRKK